jgi:hypothetical protein
MREALTHKGLGSEAGARADEAAEIADPRHGRGRRDPPPSGCRHRGGGPVAAGVRTVTGGGAHRGRSGGSGGGGGGVAAGGAGGSTRTVAVAARVGRAVAAASVASRCRPTLPPAAV